MNKNKIWMPKHEAKAFEKYNKDLEEKSKKLDWAFKTFLQFKAEKGDFDDLEPVIRHTYLKLAYGK